MYRMIPTLILTAVLSSAASPALAQEALPEGRTLMEEVNARDDGTCVERAMKLALTDRSDTTRVQRTESFRCYYGEEKRTAIYYTEPANIEDTAFLTYDYPDPDVDDDQWLYLPALRKIRRISASDRGDYFLGTDFTYEEIKKQNKVEISDYTYATVGTETVDGVKTYVVEGTPVNEAIADELGYGRVRWRVDREIAMSRKTDYWDINGNHLKTIDNVRIEQIDGIWTAVEIFAENHKTGHSTRLTFSDIVYSDNLADRYFEKRMLRRGI